MLQKLLELEEVSPGRFVSTNYQKNFRNSLFGGQAVAQSLMAAGSTAPERAPHSLHAYFLRPGKADAPITYKVDILRDGRSVSTRDVKAFQDNKLIFTMLCSFHNNEEGYHHQRKPPSSRMEPEQVIASYDEATINYLRKNKEALSLSGIEYLPFNGELISSSVSDSDFFQAWIKSDTPLPTNDLLHYCILAYVSDIGLLGSSLLQHPAHLFSGRVTPASMDHAIWFHSRPALDDWTRYVTKSPWAGSARALCTGELFDVHDQHVATVAQEGMIRPR